MIRPAPHRPRFLIDADELTVTRDLDHREDRMHYDVEGLVIRKSLALIVRVVVLAVIAGLATYGAIKLVTQ